MATSRKTTPAVKTIVKQVAGAAEKTAALAHKAERVAVKTATKPTVKTAPAKATSVAKKTVAAPAAKKTPAAPVKKAAAPVRQVGAKTALKVAASKPTAKKSAAAKKTGVSSRVTLHHGDGSDTTFDGNHQVTHVKASQVVRGEAAALAAAGVTGRPALSKPVSPDLPHGIDKLAADTADNKTLMTPVPAVQTNGGRLPDGRPATAENIGPAPGAAGAPAGAPHRATGASDWRQTGTGFSRSAPLPPGTKLMTEPSVSTERPSPALLERRFEVYPDGLGAYSWRLVIAATGNEVSVSKNSFGTPSVAEENAREEARFYQPGTVTVVRLSHNPRGSR